MHLPEIFGLSTFPVFRPYRHFDGQNYTKNFLSFWMPINFATLTENIFKRRKYTGKCQKYTGIFNIWRYMSKITVEPSIKRPKFDQYLAQIFGLLVSVKNVPKYSIFFSQKAVHFPENVPKFKTLIEMHGLNFFRPTKWSGDLERLNQTSIVFFSLIKHLTSSIL